MFSIREAITRGWQVFRHHMGFMLGVHVIAILVQVVPSLLFGDSPGLRALSVFFGLLASFVVALGLVRIGLSLVDGTGADYADLYSHAHLVFKYLVGTLGHVFLALSGACVIGLAVLAYSNVTHTPVPVAEDLNLLITLGVLALVPGAYFYAQFSQWPFIIVEREVGPFQALAQSSSLTRGSRGRLIMLYVASLAIYVIWFERWLRIAGFGLGGFLPAFVGALVIFANLTVVHAYVYRRLDSTRAGAAE
ncbi:TPA: hypothetical protein DCE37_13965 [Candidatus Latescibacteria bacterium]|nr:hypothetical protein [Candidatus Latescibacterota bacterium]